MAAGNPHRCAPKQAAQFPRLPTIRWQSDIRPILFACNSTAECHHPCGYVESDSHQANNINNLKQQHMDYIIKVSVDEAALRAATNDYESSVDFLVMQEMQWVEDSGIHTIYVENQPDYDERADELADSVN